MFEFDSAVDGWLNPPLRFHDEPCRHKVLDLIGDLSLLAQDGNQGLPVAHIVAYKVSNMSLIFLKSILIRINTVHRFPVSKCLQIELLGRMSRLE